LQPLRKPLMPVIKRWTIAVGPPHGPTHSFTWKRQPTSAIARPIAASRSFPARKDPLAGTRTLQPSDEFPDFAKAPILTIRTAPQLERDRRIPASGFDGEGWKSSWSAPFRSRIKHAPLPPVRLLLRRFPFRLVPRSGTLKVAKAALLDRPRISTAGRREGPRSPSNPRAADRHQQPAGLAPSPDMPPAFRSTCPSRVRPFLVTGALLYYFRRCT
jgi:hypothetical protein